MRSVNVAELKNRLSHYLSFVKGGEEVVIRDRNLPIARLIPFSSENENEEDLLLVAAGKMRLPQARVRLSDLDKIPTGKVSARRATRDLLEEREER